MQFLPKEFETGSTVKLKIDVPSNVFYIFCKNSSKQRNTVRLGSNVCILYRCSLSYWDIRRSVRQNLW